MFAKFVYLVMMFLPHNAFYRNVNKTKILYLGNTYLKQDIGNRYRKHIKIFLYRMIKQRGYGKILAMKIVFLQIMQTNKLRVHLR